MTVHDYMHTRSHVLARHVYKSNNNSLPSRDIRGLNSNIVTFHQFFQPLSPVALFLTETLGPLSPDTAHFQFPNYTLHYSAVPKPGICAFV